MKNRKYNFKDVDMLLASKTIVQSLTANLSDLSLTRSNWTEAYVSELGAKIDSAIEKYLGLDKKKELREATAHLSTVQTPAMQDLSFFKTQIDVDFKNDIVQKEQILKGLGFATNLRSVQKGSQEALIQLLYAFKKGMTDGLKAKITGNGTNEALIDRIIEYANKLITAEVSQESLKETTKQISEAAVNVFNEIYDEVAGICKIASLYYQHDALKKAQFTFSKVVSNMTATKSTSNDDNLTDTEAA